MAQKNCAACDELRNDAPNLIVNGMTDTECASLKNNTGLNPSSGNDDCTDLDNMNDCLIGNMEEEVELYDVCDWKDYTKELVGNLWTMFKAIICAICGIWTNIVDIRNKLQALCQLVDLTLTPGLAPRGTLIYNTSSPNYGGTIAKKGGNDVFVRSDDSIPSELQPVVGVGIRYAKIRKARCSDGGCQHVEWIAPYFYGMKVNPDVELELMDELWSVDKATAQSWGITDDMWRRMEIAPQAWTSDFTALRTALFGVRLSIENNRLVLKYYGQIGANSDSNISNKRIDSPRDTAAAVYISSCS